MGQLPGRLILCLHVDVARRRATDVDVTTSTSVPKSTVPKPHKIALDNTKGERQINFINLNSFSSCFGVRRREIIVFIGEFFLTETSCYKLQQMYELMSLDHVTRPSKNK